MLEEEPSGDDDMSDSDYLLQKFIDNQDEIKDIELKTDLRQRQINLDKSIKYLNKELGSE